MKHIIFIILVLARGPEALTRNEARAAFNKSRAVFMRAGVDLRVNRFLVMRRDPSRDYGKSLDFKVIGERAKFWRGYLRNKIPNSTIPRHVLLPPINTGDGLFWSFGMAEGVCRVYFKYPTSISSATRNQCCNCPQFQYTIESMTHEIGHILGAPHDNAAPPSVMNPACMYYTPEKGVLKFSKDSAVYMDLCLGS